MNVPTSLSANSDVPAGPAPSCEIIVTRHTKAGRSVEILISGQLPAAIEDAIMQSLVVQGARVVECRAIEKGSPR
jgi:hypothetical protein